MAKGSVGVRELRDKLSATLARVRRGETVTVTERRRPVAIIVPARDVEEEALLRTLVKSGRISWTGGRPRGLARAPRVRGEPVSDAVIEDRR